MIESRIEEITGREVDIAGELVGSGREIGTVAFERSLQAIGTITFHLIGILLALFLVYYLLKDGDELVDWLLRTMPLPADVQRDLYAEIDDVMWGVLFGHVFVGIVPGVVAGIGLAATGVPNAAFWTAVMVVLAMVPLIGAIPVWGGAVDYLYLTGDPLPAVGLFVYSVVVVGVTDDVLRPFAVDRYAKLNPAVILLCILGGAYAFGSTGLFFGPVVLGASRPRSASAWRTGRASTGVLSSERRFVLGRTTELRVSSPSLVHEPHEVGPSRMAVDEVDGTDSSPTNSARRPSVVPLVALCGDFPLPCKSYVGSGGSFATLLDGPSRHL